MGLLDQILGSVVGGALGQRGPAGGGGLGDVFGGGLGGGAAPGGGLGGVLGGGKGRLLAALLPVVLGMLANRQGGGMAAGPGSSPFGSAGAAGGLGGLGGLLEQFTRMGLGQQAQSWVSTGENEPLPAGALDGLLGRERLSEIAAQAGVSEDEARDGLAELLPEVVDRFTPGGQLPGQDELLSSIDDFERRLGGG